MSGPVIAWTTVEVFPHRSLAEVAGSAVRSAGIPARVVADDLQGIYPPLGPRGGAELQVPVEQAEEARVLLGVEEGLSIDPHDW